MGFRDDREALFQRVAALERELAQARAEADQHRAEAQAAAARLRDEAARVRAERSTQALVRVPSEAAPSLGRLPGQPLPRATQATIAAGCVISLWASTAAITGAAAWMIPAAALTAFGVARLIRRPWGWGPARRLVRRWADLPVDVTAYAGLIALPRRTVVVRVHVTFVTPVPRPQRERVRGYVRGVGAVSWDGVDLVIASGTLRTGIPDSTAEGGWTFAPDVIQDWCEQVFLRLAELHAEHRIQRIYPRARSR